MLTRGDARLPVRALLAALLAAGFSTAAMSQQIGGFPVRKEAPVALPPTREALRASLGELKDLTLAQAARLTEQAAPAVTLATSPVEDASLAAGASKFGGAPDLPPAMSWPERPAYPDAPEKRDRRRFLIGLTLAKAGIAPDWMPPDEGRRYVEERRRIERDAIERTLAGLSKDLEAEMRPLLESQVVTTPERAREETRGEVLRARLVGEPMPLSFVAQLDMRALSAEPGFDQDLPKSGRLLLFYDLLETPPGWEPGSRVGFRLIFDETPAAELRRPAIPKALEIGDDNGPLALKPARVIPRGVVTPIPPSDKAWDAIPVSAETTETFGEGPYWAYAAWLSRFGAPSVPGRTNHQLGGWPQAMQNGMQAEAQLASNGLRGGAWDAYDTPAAKEVLKGAGDWKLVLQIGVDEVIGLNAGAYYVLMRRQDLLARRFDKAWVVFQSS